MMTLQRFALAFAYGCFLAMFFAAAVEAQIGATVQTENLRLHLGSDGSVTRMEMGSLHFTPASKESAGLFLVDLADGKRRAVGLGAGTDRTTSLAQAGLIMTARVDKQLHSLLVRGVVEDSSAAGDRAVDVVFRLPFQPALWWQRISESVSPSAVDTPASRSLDAALPPGAEVLEKIEEGSLAQDTLPIACVTDPHRQGGVAIAIPPDQPTRFRLAYSTVTGSLELTLRFGLSGAAAPKLRNRAVFQFVIMPADGRWGLRDAVRRYYDLYPKSFARRTRSSGLWLFAADSLKQVPDPEHYAFWEGPRLEELNDALAQHIENYPYIIVGQRELTHLKEPPGNYEAVVADLKTKPATTGTGDWTWDEVKSMVESSGLQDANGRWIYRLRTTDWGGNSITFPLNPSPFLPASVGHPTIASSTLAEVARTLHEYPQMAGIYVDSLASWGSYYNYRREHFASSLAPLTHDDLGQVSILNWMPHVDFLNELRRRIGGRLVFGNGIRRGRAFCAFACDILGVETSSRDMRDRKDLDFYRTIAGAKPSLFLFYGDGEVTRDMAEQYVQRFVALGLSPEVRSEPSWGRYKQRDADLYARFVPLYRRLDLASWQPVTHAVVESKGVWLERFGTEPPELYFTLFNPSDQAVSVRLAADMQALHLTTRSTMKELVENGNELRLGERLVIPGRSLRIVQLAH